MDIKPLKLPKAALAQARKLTRAKKMLAEARRSLGKLTRPGHPTFVIDPQWQWAATLMNERRARLLAVPGVIGVGLGFRIRGGVRTGEPCLTVYVRRKMSADELATASVRRLPGHVSSGKRRISVDVIALGTIRRQAQAGDSLGTLELGEQATLGALARDLDRGDTVAITAMHAADLDRFPEPGTQAPEFISPMPGGTRFATMRRGTRFGIDAATLALDVQQPAITALPSGGTIRGWRPVVYPGDQDARVTMFGARNRTTGSIVNPIVTLPGEDLDAAIIVDIESDFGDSGAALVDHQGLVLGFLVGEGEFPDGNGNGLRTLRAFTPASLVLARLRCDIPTT